MEPNDRGYYVYDAGEYFHIIKFCPTGKVVGASVIKQSPLRETLASVKNWLGMAYSKNYGYWKMNGQKILFSLTSESGVVDYEATMFNEGKIVIDSHSHINGHHSYGNDYIFYQV